MIDPNELERLSKAATQGVWEFRKIGHDHLQVYNAIEHEVLSTPRSTNAAFIVALVNAYRAGQLVPVQQPSGDVETCEDIVRGIAGDPCSCGVMHYAITCLPCRCKAAITAYEALRAKDTRP